MPLVVPGLMTSASNKDDKQNTQEDWMAKLIGKKITDGSSDEVVWTAFAHFAFRFGSCLEKIDADILFPAEFCKK